MNDWCHFVLVVKISPWIYKGQRKTFGFLFIYIILTTYESLTGIVMFLTLMLSDISHAVGVTSPYMQNQKKHHLQFLPTIKDNRLTYLGHILYIGYFFSLLMTVIFHWSLLLISLHMIHIFPFHLWSVISWMSLFYMS